MVLELVLNLSVENKDLCRFPADFQARPSTVTDLPESQQTGQLIRPERAQGEP